MLQTLNNLKLSAANLTIAIIESEQKNTDASDLRLRLRYVRMMIKTLDSVYNSSIVDTVRFNRLSQYVTYLVGSYITIPGSSSSISANIVSQPENNLPDYLSGGYEAVVINSITNALERTDIISAINSLIANNANGYLTTIAGIAAGGDLSGTFPNPTVSKFNGQLPSYYLNYNNLTNIPAPLDLSGYLTSSTAATTYYPLSLNPAGYLTGITGSQVNSALGYAPENPANKGIANGYVPLNNSIKIDAAYLPSYVSDIVTAASFSALPTTGTAGFLYITADTNYEYRWNVGTNAYIRLVASPGTTDALAEGVSNLYYTNARVAAYGDTRYAQLSSSNTYTGAQTFNGDITLNSIHIQMPAGATEGAVYYNHFGVLTPSPGVFINGGTLMIGSTTPPPPYAPLDLANAPGGILMPQFSQTSRLAINLVPSGFGASDAYGLQVYQVDGTVGQYVNLNGTWQRFLTTADPAASAVTGGVINWPGAIFTSPTTGTYSSGILSFAPALANQNANYGFMGPVSGVAGIPSFRSLVANDIPGTLNGTSFSGNVTVTGFFQSGNQGQFGGDAANNITYIGGVNASSVPFVDLTFNYHAKAVNFGNAGNALTDAQNNDDFLLGSAQNINISNGGGTQAGVYAQFNAANKSLILNNGGTFTANSSAILQLNSTAQGFLPPSMTTTQKNAIATPATGLVVFDNSLGKLNIYNGTGWETFNSSTGSAVTSVFGRTGAVTATSGDYNTLQVTETTNLYFTNARAIAAPLTGYTSGAGTVSATDSVLQAIQKLNGNIAVNTSNFANYGALSGNNSWTGSNTWSVQANFATVVISDSHVLSFKSGSFVGQIQPSLLTASRNYNLPDKTGTLAMTNDNVSEFTNDAGYLTSSSGITSIVGTANQVTVSGAGSVKTLSLPQSIATVSDVTFNSVTSNGANSTFFKSLLINNTFGTPQSWQLGNDVSGSNDGIFYIYNKTATTFAHQIDKSNNTTLFGNLILNGPSGQPIFFNTAGVNTALMGNHSQAIGGGGSTSDFNLYIQGDNPFTLWTNGATRFSIQGNGVAAFSNSLSSFALVGNGSTPSATALSCAGVGATVSVTGTNTSGIVTLTTGTSTTVGNIVNITMANGFSFPNLANGIAQINTTAALLPAGVTFNTNSSSTIFQIQVGGGALAPNTTYKINYIIIGY